MLVDTMDSRMVECTQSSLSGVQTPLRVHQQMLWCCRGCALSSKPTSVHGAVSLATYDSGKGYISIRTPSWGRDSCRSPIVAAPQTHRDRAHSCTTVSHLTGLHRHAACTRSTTAAPLHPQRDLGHPLHSLSEESLHTRACCVQWLA